MNTSRSLNLKVKQLRNSCQTYDTYKVSIQCNDSNCTIKGKNWEKEINISQSNLLQLAKSGFLRFEDQNIRTISLDVLNGIHEVTIDHQMLTIHKKGNPLIAYFLVFFGIILLIAGFFMKYNGAIAKGTVVLTRYGNQSGDTILTWWSFVVVGVFLLFASLFFIDFRRKKKQD